MTGSGPDLRAALELKTDETAGGWVGPSSGPADGGTEPVMRWCTRMLDGGASLRSRVSTADTVLFWHSGAPLHVVSDGELLAVLGGAQDVHHLRQYTVALGVTHAIHSGGGDLALWSEASVPGKADWNYAAEPEPPAGLSTPAEDEGSGPSTIELFDLTEHIEGGYYRQLWESRGTLETGRGERTLANTILYLLDRRSPIGRLHLNASDITHFSHGAAAVDYLLVAPDGSVHERRLGMDVTNGEVPALTVPGGWWKASSLPEGRDEALISEIAAPGFVFEDQRLARVEDVPELFPEHVERMVPYAFG